MGINEVNSSASAQQPHTYWLFTLLNIAAAAVESSAKLYLNLILLGLDKKAEYQLQLAKYTFIMLIF